jgi:iron(III) transport system permease protein
MAKPMIFLGLLLIVMEIISDYGTVHLLGIRTLTVGIYDTWFFMFNPRLAAWFSLVAYAVPLLALLIFTRFSRHASFYNPPNRSSVVRKRPVNSGQAAVIIFFLSIPLFTGFLIPLFVLVLWTIEKLGVTRTATLFMDLINTLSLSVIVSGISIIISSIFTYLKRKYGSHFLVNAAGWIVCAQYAVPGIVIGIAFLFLTRALYSLPVTRWLMNSVFLIVVACVIRYLCFGFFSIESGMRRISGLIDEHARTLGKSSRYLLFHVHLPMLKPSIIVGCILVFVAMIKELTISLVLQPFHYSSLALRIFSYSNMDMLKNSALYALFLVLICIYPVFSLYRWFNPEENRI